MTEENGNDIKEVAKTTGKAIDLANRAGSFINSIIGGGLKELGESFHDWASYFRYRNLLSIQNKVEKIYRDRGIKGERTSIPPRLAIPLINEASLEDNAEVQQLWANLIANSTDPNSSKGVHPAFVDVIKQLMPDEAIIIQHFKDLDNHPVVISVDRHFRSQQINIPDESLYEEIKYIFEEKCKEYNLSAPHNSIAYFDNLRRLQIIELDSNEDLRIIDSNVATSFPSEQVELEHFIREYLMLTEFGQQFIDACVIEKKA